MAYEAALTALSDPTRRLVFERILGAPRPVASIAEGLPVSRPAVSQHLKVLKEAGLITERHNGTRRLYMADPQALGIRAGNNSATPPQACASAISAAGAECSSAISLTTPIPLQPEERELS